MTVSCKDYNFSQIESHWQSFWAKHKTFRAIDRSDKPKYYVLDMFPYPSGDGLHVGHPAGYTASDIVARYKKARGYNVLHPMGWDAFGLPAEQYALQTGTHPADRTKQNIDHFRHQIQQLGFALDWEREICTSDPTYYRWTQWIFLQLFKHGLAYVEKRPVRWCPELGTVLANEEVVNGRSERGGHPVERRDLAQWVLRITAYADKLLQGLEGLDWPDSTKRQQIAWIGRSQGVDVRFPLQGLYRDIIVFTTRPETLFGATYLVVAPEHPLLSELVSSDQRRAVTAYVQNASHKSERERTNQDKSGVFTGRFAVNPINQKAIPIWVADYVLGTYGTGAIMAVPAHDERDYDFATQYHLPIIPVVQSFDGVTAPLPLSDAGILIDSGPYTGLNSENAKQTFISDLERNGQGKRAIQYKLRDWLFSRQRYWGEPFPIIWVDESAYQRTLALHASAIRPLLPQQPVTSQKGERRYFALPIPACELPVTLPTLEAYKPAGTAESPLVNVMQWVDVYLNLKTGETRPASSQNLAGKDWVRGRRETHTMPQWAGSCWYHLRYLDPHNTEALVASTSESYWRTPDLYIGGAEHAVLHLLYARFWHHFLHDIGAISTPEPYQRLIHQGMVLGEDGEKMSKSRGNVINPDKVVAEHGADSLRLYEMFLGPLEAKKPWSTHGIEGVHRFLRKVWRTFIDSSGRSSAKIIADASSQEKQETERLLQSTIKKVTEAIETLSFNIGISQMMIFMNHLSRIESITLSTARTFVQLLAPFAPHISEELWERLGGTPSVSEAPWPLFDAHKWVEEQTKIAFQINGKVRGDALLSKDASEQTALEQAKTHSKVALHLKGKRIVNVIYVPGKILNLVVR